MCAPDHYGIDYIINPWMEGQLGQSDRSLAHKQWQDLRNALATQAEITSMPAEPELPDLVFTANAGLLLGETVVISRFRTPERQREEPFFHAWFEKNGFDVAPWPKEISFEGAGDALFDRAQPLLWMGYGFRSDREAASHLETIFGRRVAAVHLVDPRFYHLDTCLCPLEGGWLMYYPSAFDEESQKLIKSIVPPEKQIIVNDADALHFSCNAVDLNGHIYMNDASPELKNKLKAAGFECVQTPLTQFLKAGGAAKCLTLKLIEP